MELSHTKEHVIKTDAKRILIVDDHPVFRHGITALIEADCNVRTTSPGRFFASKTHVPSFSRRIFGFATAEIYGRRARNVSGGEHFSAATF